MTEPHGCSLYNQACICSCAPSLGPGKDDSRRRVELSLKYKYCMSIFRWPDGLVNRSPPNLAISSKQAKRKVLACRAQSAQSRTASVHIGGAQTTQSTSCDLCMLRWHRYVPLSRRDLRESDPAEAAAAVTEGEPACRLAARAARVQALPQAGLAQQPAYSEQTCNSSLIGSQCWASTFSGQQQAARQRQGHRTYTETVEVRPSGQLLCLHTTLTGNPGLC